MVERTLEDVETNTTQPVDVGVVYLGEEADFGWGHRVVVGKEQLKLEDTAWTMMSASFLTARRVPARCLAWAIYPHMETAKGHRW